MLQTIPIKTTIPTGTPSAEGALEANGLASRGNVLEIFGTATVGSGSLVLLRYLADLELWRPFREYHAISVDASALAGHFSGSYSLPTGTDYYVLYTPDSVTATARAQLRSY